jgi:lambda repressor-like predicted transcriptional regulator
MQHLFHRQEGNIAAELTQVGFSLDALSRMNGTLEKLVQGIPVACN